MLPSMNYLDFNSFYPLAMMGNNNYFTSSFAMNSNNYLFAQPQQQIQQEQIKQQQIIAKAAKPKEARQATTTPTPKVAVVEPKKNSALEGAYLGLDKSLDDMHARNFRRTEAFGQNVRSLAGQEVSATSYENAAKELANAKDKLKAAETSGNTELIKQLKSEVAQQQAAFDETAVQLQKELVKHSKSALKEAKLKQEFYKKFLKLTQKGDEQGITKLFTTQKKYEPFIEDAEALKQSLKPQELEQAINNIIEGGKSNIKQFGKNVKTAKATTLTSEQAQAAKEAAKAAAKETAKTATKPGFWKNLGKNMADQFPKTTQFMSKLHMPKWLSTCGKGMGKGLSVCGKVLGKLAWPLAIGCEAIDVCQTANKHGWASKQTAKATTKAAGGLAGASIGAKTGAAVGASIGALFGGAGAVPGAFIGGIIGGAIGYFTGSIVTEVTFDAVAGKTED